MSHRTVTLANGRKVYQRYIGADPTLADSERESLWETVELDAQGDPYRYRVSPDIHVGVSHQGGVLVSIAGVTFGIPREQLTDLAAVLREALKDAKQRAQEYAAEAKAERERQAAASAPQEDLAGGPDAASGA